MKMDTLIKLENVAVQMHLEPAEELPYRPQPILKQPVAPCGHTPLSARAQAKKEALGIFNAALPGGKTIPLLKTMLTSACERDCYYCPFRAGRNYRRTTFKPEEMAGAFMDMNRAGMVQGLFLSSGIIKGGVRTQDKLLETAEILRQKHQFHGYIHLKIMPGIEKAQVERAMQLADRLSVNLEAPNDKRLALLAPRKRFVDELLQPLKWIEEIRQNQPPHLGWKGRWPSSATQFVVGAAGESDLEILTTSAYLYQQLRLRRTFFSAFSPVADTPLEDQPPEDPKREHRLYQASYLFRDYGFDLEEMPFSQSGKLPLAIDPKLAWAEMHLKEEPVEVNRASRGELLRIPGVGHKGARAVLAARRRGTLRDIYDLQAIGVRTKRVKPYVLLDGKRPAYQPRLFSVAWES
jgi:predicted DNA-binding helix-hairpin-helix protein